MLIKKIRWKRTATIQFHSHVRYKAESNKDTNKTKTQFITQATERWFPERREIGEVDESKEGQIYGD